jgi:non-specific serine/threonine protein kinase
VEVARPRGDLERLAGEVPPLLGAEYVDAARLEAWWGDLEEFFRGEVRRHRGSVQSYLQARNPAWTLVGRVHFHLAENRQDDAYPFAFLATYTTRLSDRARPQHQPLGQAIRSFAGDRSALLSLLAPVDRAAGQSRFLKDLPAFEAAGIIVRVPDWWHTRRRLTVSATVGARPPATLGLDALLDLSVAVTLDGEPISEQEWREILAGTDGLALVRGKWVDRLREVLAHWERARRAAREGLSFRDAMRLLAGTGLGDDEPAAGPPDAADWSRVVAGAWLRQTLERMRHPDELAAGGPIPGLRATCRPYQTTGVHWLSFLCRLGLGACLADDMGLGKTIQVLARSGGRRASRGGPASWSSPPPSSPTGSARSRASPPGSRHSWRTRRWLPPAHWPRRPRRGRSTS